MTRWKQVAIIGFLLLYSGSLSSAGEIVLSPQTDSRNKTSGASRNREKAHSYQDGDASLPPSSIILVPEEEEGILSPRGIGTPADNRSKAREYLRDKDHDLPAVIVVPTESSSDGSGSTRDNLERNVDKARGYLDGGGRSFSKPGTYVKIGTSVGVVGKDGVIVFDCSDTNNIKGRIGEDSGSGSEFTVVINSRNHKARCR